MSYFRIKLAELESLIASANQPWTPPERWSAYCRRHAATDPDLGAQEARPANFISIQNHSDYLGTRLPENTILLRAGSGEFSLVRLPKSETSISYFLPDSEIEHQHLSFQPRFDQVEAICRLADNFNEQLSLNLTLQYQAPELAKILNLSGFQQVVQTWKRTFPKGYALQPTHHYPTFSLNVSAAQWEADLILQDLSDPKHYILFEAKKLDTQLFKSKLYFPAKLALHYLGDRADRITPVFFVGSFDRKSGKIDCHIQVCSEVTHESTLEDLIYKRK